MNALEPIFRKIRMGQRISEDDALNLFRSPDLVSIGQMADLVNRQKNGRNVYFNVNRHVNPTNVCALSCKFCSFSRKPGEEGAYTFSIDEILAKAAEAFQQQATEIHMVGGLHPRWTFQHYLDIISAVKTKFPSLHIKAFTAVELDWMARRDRRSIKEILTDLVNAGLGSIPGGGAEIFHPEIRDQICDTKVSADQWIETHRLAHSMGLRSNCTMLYGHIEGFEHRVDHMRRLRALQDETKGFSAFIPLAFQPDDNNIGKTRYTYGFDDLKTMAVARLYLDNFQNIKAYWIMLGQDIAQLALNFGANDIDGTVTEEKISKMAGGRAGIVMTRPEIEALIRAADGHPVERDTLYRPIGALQLPTEGTFEDRPLFRSITENNRILPKLSAPKCGSFATSIRFSDWENLTTPTFSANYIRAELRRSRSSKPTVESQIFESNSQGEAESSSDSTWAGLSQPSGDYPSTLVWDLSSGSFAMSRLTLPELSQQFTRTQAEFPFLTQVICGIDGLVAWALRQNQVIEDVLWAFKAAGIVTLEHEASDILPSVGDCDLEVLKRVLDFHDLCHRLGLFSSARILIGQGDTEEGVRELIGCYASHEEQQPGFLALHVAAETDVPPIHFLAALGWVRGAMGAIKEMVTPFFEVASLRGRSVIGDLERSPLLKVAPLSLLFGATDLGHLFVGRAQPQLLHREITAFGCTSQNRNGKFLRLATTEAILNGSTKRETVFFHAPELPKAALDLLPLTVPKVRGIHATTPQTH